MELLTCAGWGQSVMVGSKEVRSSLEKYRGCSYVPKLQNRFQVSLRNTWVPRDEIMGRYPRRNCWVKNPRGCSRMFFHEDVFENLKPERG